MMKRPLLSQDLFLCLKGLVTIPCYNISGMQDTWEPYEFSMRYGIKDDPSHQGFHGLKGKISDQFIALGTTTFASTEMIYSQEAAGEVYYLWSTFDPGMEKTANLQINGIQPEQLWLNGSRIETANQQVNVNPSHNQVLLRYDQPGRGYVVFESALVTKPWQQEYPLAMS